MPPKRRDRSARIARQQQRASLLRLKRPPFADRELDWLRSSDSSSRGAISVVARSDTRDRARSSHARTTPSAGSETRYREFPASPYGAVGSGSRCYAVESAPPSRAECSYFLPAASDSDDARGTIGQSWLWLRVWGSTPKPRTVVKGWKASNPALRLCVASLGCVAVQYIRNHRVRFIYLSINLTFRRFKLPRRDQGAIPMCPAYVAS